MSDFIGKWPLGYKEAGSNEDGLLGMEWYTVVTDHVAGRDLTIASTRVYVKWVKNTGATVISPGQAVQIDQSEDHIYAVEDITVVGAQACGICDPTLTEDVAVGEKFLIVIEGYTDVLTGAALAVGVPIGVGANGVAIAASPAYGVMVEAATAASQLRRANVGFRSGDYSQSQSVVGAAAQGVTNTILPSSTLVSVTGTNNADGFVVLPALASVPNGHRITVLGSAASNFEVRTPATSTGLINNVNSDGTAEYLFLNTQVHYFTKISNTVGWMANGYTAIGAVATAVIPD